MLQKSVEKPLENALHNKRLALPAITVFSTCSEPVHINERILRTDGEKRVFAAKLNLLLRGAFFKRFFLWISKATGFTNKITFLLNFQFPALLLLRSQPGEKQHETRLL